MNLPARVCRGLFFFSVFKRHVPSAVVGNFVSNDRFVSGPAGLADGIFYAIAIQLSAELTMVAIRCSSPVHRFLVRVLSPALGLLVSKMKRRSDVSSRISF
jgi:hypothetical protein